MDGNENVEMPQDVTIVPKSSAAKRTYRWGVRGKSCRDGIVWFYYTESRSARKRTE